MDKVSKKNKMISERIKRLRSKFHSLDIDGYIIPKNDEYFSEYSSKDRLKTISNFSGSAGYAVILKKKNYLFVDGRYTLQAQLESGYLFNIINIQNIINCKLFKNLSLGIDSKLFTSHQLKTFFKVKTKIKKFNFNLVDTIFNKYTLPKPKPFFSLSTKIVGENHLKKIKKICVYLKKEKMDYLFVSAPENIAWVLNIRGYDNPHSPIPNCRLLISKTGKIYCISNLIKLKKIIKEKKLKKENVIQIKNFKIFTKKLNNKRIVIDKKSCSLYYENLFKEKAKIFIKEDPIYYLKSIKNRKEIYNMIKSHVIDGVALTRFLYWIQNINKKKITEYEAQKKLESFRRKNKSYLFSSFNTIAGTGANASIIHYRAEKKTSKIINKKDIFLCDSGGQYNYGTTDVTRTIHFGKPKKYMKDIFTRVLKGHIAVVTANLKKFYNGALIDNLARKNLKDIGLDYEHGTGHGVGFFLNVHEGPQSISKFNKVKLKEGMVLSNEPGYYNKGKFGIRIENLIFVDRNKKGLFFENLTLVPIEKKLINYNELNKIEKDYLYKYHLNVYSKLFYYLNKVERRWLASFI